MNNGVARGGVVKWCGCWSEIHIWPGIFISTLYCYVYLSIMYLCFIISSMSICSFLPETNYQEVTNETRHEGKMKRKVLGNFFQHARGPIDDRHDTQI